MAEPQCKFADQCPLGGLVRLNRSIDAKCFWLCRARPAVSQLSEGRLVEDVKFEDPRWEYDPYNEGVKN